MGWDGAAEGHGDGAHCLFPSLEGGKKLLPCRENSTSNTQFLLRNTNKPCWSGFQLPSPSLTSLLLPLLSYGKSFTLALFGCPFPVDLGTLGVLFWPLLLQRQQERDNPDILFIYLF